MKNTREIIIEDSIRDLIESLDYEYSTRKDAIAFMVSNNMNINTDSFKQYQQEMIEFNVKFIEAKKQLEEKYVLPVIDDYKVNWTLDYRTSKLIITFLEKGKI